MKKKPPTKTVPLNRFPGASPHAVRKQMLTKRNKRMKITLWRGTSQIKSGREDAE